MVLNIIVEIKAYHSEQSIHHVSENKSLQKLLGIVRFKSESDTD